MLRRRLDRRIPIAAVLVIGSLALVGCGTTVEQGAQKFLSEHGSEARRTAGLVTALAAAVQALPGKPSLAQLEALDIDGHRAHRALLAASNWNVTEDGEEEGVSQAEKEIHEGTSALLNAAGDIHLYSLKQRPVSLSAYRHELAAGREYWNQGMGELWFVAKKSGPPRI